MAVCTNREVKPKTVESLLNLVAYNNEYQFHILIATQGYTIAENRNYCVIQAKLAECDYLLFIDDDMVFPADTLEKLLEAKKEIIGINSYSRILPLSTTVALKDEKGNIIPRHSVPRYDLPDELFECYSVGTGLLLINMDVFGKIEQPYFAFKMMDIGKVLTGEDAWFCEQAKKAGYNIYCDPKIKVGHIGQFVYQKEEKID